MADSLTPRTPITQLPTAAPLTGAELVPMVQGGVTVKAAASALTSQAISGGTIAGAPGQTALTVTASGAPNSHGLVVTGDMLLNGVSISILGRNVRNSDYTFSMEDVSGFVYHTDAGANTYTIPDNTDLPFTIGTPITISLGGTSGNVTITPGGSVLLRQAGTTNTGARTLAANAMATLLKVDTDEWVINGVGVT